MSNYDFPIELKEFDVEDIYNAIAENGLEHLRGKWIDADSSGKLTGACVLGQGAANLGVFTEATALLHDIETFFYDLDKTITDDERDNDYEGPNYLVDNAVETYNDHTLENALNGFETPLTSKWRVKSIYGIGSLIIYWNDNIENEEWIEGRKVQNYTLKTYEAVTAMAHDLLSPYFGEKIKLAVKRYEFARKSL